MRFLFLVGLFLVIGVQAPAGQGLTPHLDMKQRSTPVKIWADKSTDVDGRVSRDGRILPFVDWTTFGLSVRDLGTGEIRALAPGKQPAYPRTSTPSPDAKQIAYVLERSLFIVSVTGGQPKLVYEHPELSAVGDWTSDGASLIVTRMADARAQEIGLVNIESRTYRKLAESRGAASFSAARTQPLVVYEQWTPDALSHRELRILSLTDGSVSVLLTGADDFSPLWSPKDDAVVFVSNRDRRRGLWSIAIRDGRAAGPPRLLQELNEDMWLNGLAVDGTAYFAHYGGTMTTAVARVTWPDGNVSEPKVIPTPRFLGSRRPLFSSDGKMLATLLRAAVPGVRPGWQTPAVTDLATGRQWTFPSDLTIRDEIAWLTDGRSLLVINDDPGSGEGSGPPWSFWRLSLADQSWTRLGSARASGLVRLAGLTEREVVYRRNVFGPPAVSYIEAFDLRTGRTRELYRHTGDEVTDASLSPDGRQVALTARGATQTDIYLLRIGETSTSKVALSNFRASARPQSMWMATQDALIVSGALAGQDGIWRVPLNGEAPQRLKLNATGLYEARLSQDGQFLAFTTRPAPGRELWMLRGAIAY